MRFIGSQTHTHSQTHHKPPNGVFGFLVCNFNTINADCNGHTQSLASYISHVECVSADQYTCFGVCVCDIAPARNTTQSNILLFYCRPYNASFGRMCTRGTYEPKSETQQTIYTETTATYIVRHIAVWYHTNMFNFSYAVSIMWPMGSTAYITNNEREYESKWNVVFE